MGLQFVEVSLVFIIALSALGLSWFQAFKGKCYFDRISEAMQRSLTSTDREKVTEVIKSAKTDRCNATPRSKETIKSTETEKARNNVGSVNDLRMALQDVETRASVIGLLYLVAAMSFIIVYARFAWR